MRLLYISHSFPPPNRPLANVGGMQRVATELYAALERQQEVQLSSVLLRSSWRWTHVRAAPFLLKAIARIRQSALRGEIDAVLFSSMVTASLAVPLRRMLADRRIPTAAIIHGRDITLPFAPYQHFVPRVFEALDAVFPVSRASGEQCLQRGLAPDKMHVLPNGIDPERFSGIAQHLVREEVSDAYGLPPRPGGQALLLLSVGRQVARKGFGWFVEHVMPRLPEHVHYWLAGDGPETENIRAAIQRHGLQHRVRLLGRVSERALEQLYRTADLFVMPNLHVPGDMEGFGVVLLEAGLCGAPAVAADLEGIRDVISEARNGHLVESGNADAFARVIRHYDMNRRTLAAAGRRASEYVASTFNWPSVATRYVRELESLVQQIQTGVSMPPSLQA